MAGKTKPVTATLTFDNGQKVTVRELTNGDELAAMRVLGQSDITNQNAFAIVAQHEMLKHVVVKIDGKALSATDRESVSDLLGENLEQLVHFLNEQKKAKSSKKKAPTITYETDGSDSSST